MSRGIAQKNAPEPFTSLSGEELAQGRYLITKLGN